VAEERPRPWLTVVTVVKDAPGDFLRTIESVASQDLAGVEYVVIDGSRDTNAVPTCMGAFPNLPVDYVWSAPQGIYPAMNEGLARASGEYVHFANAGDVFYDPSVLGRVRTAAESTDAPWIFGDVEILSPSGHRVITPRWDYANEKSASFSRGHFPCHQGTFAKRSLLLAQGGFDPSYSIVADYAAFLKLSLVGDPGHLDFVVATFAEGGVSTTQWRESFRQFHRARREILQPRGRAALREYRETVKRYAAVEFYRSVWSKAVRP
jgi:glycosyltransferase involved in cell wall biosynthesis